MHLMQMMLSSKSYQNTTPAIDTPLEKLNFPKWESKVAFGIY